MRRTHGGQHPTNGTLLGTVPGAQLHGVVPHGSVGKPVPIAVLNVNGPSVVMLSVHGGQQLSPTGG